MAVAFSSFKKPNLLLIALTSITDTMSRLDYITIAIVAACILAIIFLVYKMTDLFKKGEVDSNKIETVTDTIEEEDDDVYDYEIDNAVDSIGAAATDKTTQPAPSQPSSPATPSVKETELDAADSPSENDTETPPSVKAKPEGRYMVLGGSFTKKALAEAEARKLKEKGYDHASVEIFDRGKYAVVMIDRFDNMADAEKLVKKLKSDNVKCYIKMKSAQ